MYEFTECLHKIKTTSSVNQWNFRHFFYIILLDYKTNKMYTNRFFLWIINVFVSNGMTRRCNPKIWLFSNVFHKQKKLLIWTLLIQIKGSVPLRPGEKIRKFEKVKILFIVWSQCAFRCINSYIKKYQCSKLNTYLVQPFFQSGGIVLTLKFHWD